MMASVIIGLHVVVCVMLTVVVLLQQGKGADIGAVFGGSSQTLFGASGAGNLLTKVTGVLALVFFATSLYLAYFSNARVSSSIFDRSLRGAPPAPAAPGASKGTSKAAGTAAHGQPGALPKK
jgi:preprotein translocase subunit SecG